MSNENNIEKIDLDKVDWRGSREFFESLGEALDKLDDKDESYDFTWVGKRKAIIEAGAPINKTFRPDVEASKNWDTTENLFIEGDNLDALKLLQESYLGKVKMIYIDPPYNTGKDFVYHDNFKATTADYDEDTEYKNDEGNIQFKKNEKSNGRYHSDWLSMIYPRLKLARNLLTKDGVIFISIDDNEQANLRKLCDEVFGEDNFIGNICHKSRGSVSNDKIISSNHNFILLYARDFEVVFNNRKRIGLDPIIEGFSDTDERGKYKLVPVDGPGGAKKGNPHYEFQGVVGYFRYSKETMQQLFDDGKVVKRGTGLQRKYYLEDALKSRRTDTTWWGQNFFTSSATGALKKLMDGDFFDSPKPVDLIVHMAKQFTNSDDVILDFFSGSATTAHASMQLNAEDDGNRKWIMVQLPEETDEKSEAYKAGYKTIPEISRERIRRAGDKITVEQPDAKVDYGFRALKITDTNYKEIYKSAGEYQQSTLLDTVDNIKDDRSELDLLYGVLTQSAMELNREIIKENIDGSDVYIYDYQNSAKEYRTIKEKSGSVKTIANQGLVACFNKNITDTVVKEIAKMEPSMAVFRDSSFTDSQAKVNLAENFRILSPDTRVKVI